MTVETTLRANSNGGNGIQHLQNTWVSIWNGSDKFSFGNQQAAWIIWHHLCLSFWVPHAQLKLRTEWNFFYSACSGLNLDMLHKYLCRKYSLTQPLTVIHPIQILKKKKTWSVWAPKFDPDFAESFNLSHAIHESGVTGRTVLWVCDVRLLPGHFQGISFFTYQNHNQHAQRKCALTEPTSFCQILAHNSVKKLSNQLKIFLFGETSDKNEKKNNNKSHESWILPWSRKKKLLQKTQRNTNSEVLEHHWWLSLGTFFSKLSHTYQKQQPGIKNHCIWIVCVLPSFALISSQTGKLQTQRLKVAPFVWEDSLQRSLWRKIWHISWLQHRCPAWDQGYRGLYICGRLSGGVGRCWDKLGTQTHKSSNLSWSGIHACLRSRKVEPLSEKEQFG